MILVTRYLSVNRAERRTKIELTWSLLGSDRPVGLCRTIPPLSRSWPAFTESLSLYPCLSPIICWFGLMFVSEERELMSSKMFPSQWKSSEFSK
ncbi:hypothetical protein SCLCIDRAFT_812972 [Scleroderma citrinum Foug A]|uniref:Uncharacterized protein n=1 Tax=Scleroderma citrinum Foug A TaxID=1036808 RepID=A0A0C3E8J7_9AGAM|nr:hypothetical protein SCLCIDRAFT_812972 [Scleroderma citrinum Foug A]